MICRHYEQTSWLLYNQCTNEIYVFKQWKCISDSVYWYMEIKTNERTGVTKMVSSELFQTAIYRMQHECLGDGETSQVCNR